MTESSQGQLRVAKFSTTEGEIQEMRIELFRLGRDVAAALVMLGCLVFPAVTMAQATGPSVLLSPGALSFGNLAVGASSAPQTETVTAQGSPVSGVTFGSAALTGPNTSDFTVQSDNCSGTTIYAGSCQIAIVFHPSGAGSRSATVSVDDNASGSPRLFAVQGTGIPVVLTSVVISPISPSVVSGSQLQLSAQGTYSDGSQKDVTGVATWTSSDSEVATVQQGLTTGVRAGRAAITAALGKAKGRVSLGVEYQILFSMQPGTTPVSKAISPGVRVRVLDNGSPVENLPVTIDIGPNPPNPAELSGHRTRTTDEGGAVTFEDLKLDYFGSGYTLVASAPGPGGRSTALSAPFIETRVGDPCLGPNPACSSGCPDTDGDGLNDAWENAGGIDMNGDGRIDEKHDLMLRGADPNKQDVFVQYDWMDYSTPGNACNIDSDCTTGVSAGHSGETCTGVQVLPSQAASCRYACSADLDCTSRGVGHLGEKCAANSCVHTHDPDAIAPGALQAVVDSFAAHGINLHLLRGHALPHSLVTSFRLNSQMTDVCEGASLAGGAAGKGKYAESLYDLKAASSLDPLKIAYHYGLFGHYSGCDSREHCMACPPSLNPNGSNKNEPAFGQSGMAEVSGNDFVVSLGVRLQDLLHEPGTFDVGSTFMHELGHNLGLRHGGGIDTPCTTAGAACPLGGVCTQTGVGKFCLAGEDINAKPNYLSVMNYRYQFTGIAYAGAVGSSLPIGQRLDYSSQVLPAGGNTPGYLDQSTVPNSPAASDPGLGLNEPAGLGSGVTDIFTFTDARETGIPRVAASTGPVDWNGDGAFTGLNVQADTICGPAGFGDHLCTSLAYPILKGHADWGPAGQNSFTYQFQCTAYGGPQGDGASATPFVQHEMPARMAILAHVALPPRSVNIAIRPGCAGKLVAPGQAGTVSVALLGSDDFDVLEVDPASLGFHGAKLLGTTIRDIDSDGRPDLVAVFEMQSVRLHPSATLATLTGWMKNSQLFVGEDAVAVVSRLGPGEASCR
jgi:hypothetical protein